jgi:hypothetical protein
MGVVHGSSAWEECISYKMLLLLLVVPGCSSSLPTTNTGLPIYFATSSTSLKRPAGVERKEDWGAGVKKGRG